MANSRIPTPFQGEFPQIHDVFYIYYQPGIESMDDGRKKVRAGIPPIATEVTNAAYCFPEFAAPEDMPIRLICAGREQCLPDYHVSHSEFPCIIIEFVFEGKGKLRVGDSMHDLQPGSLCSYGMDVPHDLWSDPTQPMNKYFAIYANESHQEGSSVIGIRPGQVKSSLEIHTLQVLFEQMIREGRKSGPMHGMISNQYLRLILLKSCIAVRVDKKENVQNGGQATFERTVAYIEKHYEEVSSLAELSTAVERSPAYLCRLFRRFGQETPHRCIMRHKLNRAAELLMNQTMNVTEVSTAVGYHDTFHFSRLFKKRFGHSPKNFCKGIVTIEQSD